MHISELRKRTQQQIMGGDWDVPYALQDWLEKNGFEMVGSGFFSRVFAQPGSNKIVKIMGVRNPSETACGVEFAKFQRRTNNKHFPKVFAVKQYKTGGFQHRSFDDIPDRTNPLTVIIMENIPYPFDGKKVRWKRDKMYNMGLGAFLLNRDIIGPLDIVDREQYFPEDWRDRFGSPSTPDANQEEVRWLAKYSNDSVVRAIKTIHSLARKHDCRFADFKYENTRMREDGTIVFIDALPF